MKWTVVYHPAAENELIDLWLAAPDQADVTYAANLIERRLRRDPYTYSESRDDNSRIMIESPLAFGYDVSDDDCMVTVWSVWRIK